MKSERNIPTVKSGMESDSRGMSERPKERLTNIRWAHDAEVRRSMNRWVKLLMGTSCCLLFAASSWAQNNSKGPGTPSSPAMPDYGQRAPGTPATPAMPEDRSKPLPGTTPKFNSPAPQSGQMHMVRGAKKKRTPARKKVGKKKKKATGK